MCEETTENSECKMRDARQCTAYSDPAMHPARSTASGDQFDNNIRAL